MDLSGIRTPAFVLDTAALGKNLSVLQRVIDRTGVKILLALKGFSMFGAFEPIRRVLSGTTASSLNEARLGAEEFGGETHVYAPAYRPDEFPELLRYAGHVSFNSPAQRRLFAPEIARAPKKIETALRVNPEHSEVKTPLYDPCQPFSRLGTRACDLEGENLDGLDGLHFHTLCELGADALERTLAAVEAKFAPQLSRVRWVNFGGGHHITRPGYDVDLLCRLIDAFKARYGVQVYLEPGEAVVLNAGVLAVSVLDIVSTGMNVAILDTSAATHMPDVLEMPYRPEIEGAGKPGDFPHTYRLGGVSCLAGDIVGDYSFPEPLRVGQRLIFKDMAHYSMVKTTTFNGVNLPDIAMTDDAGAVKVLRRFGYGDFKSRLS